MRSLYDRDFYIWAKRQAAALKRRDVEAIDWENVTEEIEALAREDERALRNGYSTIIQNFLKLQYGDYWERWRLTMRYGRPVARSRACLGTVPDWLPSAGACTARRGRWARERAISELVQRAIARITDEEKWAQEAKRLRQAWSGLLPQKNPYSRRQVEDDFWRPARIPLADRPHLEPQP